MRGDFSLRWASRYGQLPVHLHPRLSWVHFVAVLAMWDVSEACSLERAGDPLRCCWSVGLASRHLVLGASRQPLSLLLLVDFLEVNCVIFNRAEACLHRASFVSVFEDVFREGLGMVGAPSNQNYSTFLHVSKL